MTEKKPDLNSTLEKLRQQIDASEPGSIEQERLVKSYSELLKAKHDTKPDWIWKTVDASLKGLGIILPIYSFGKWLDVCMKFEETGVLTGSATKALVKFIKPVLK